MKERIIFHIDVNNAFLSWSAVLLLKQGYKKDIRTVPSIIAGNKEERRGIVLAKSPVAKKYGVVTAETIYSAKKKCKDIEIFPPNYKWYREKSKELFSYLSNYSPLLEQASIDECYLDMTGMNYIYKDYIELANKIKNDIKKKFGYTVNIGIANNKLCAKMASDFEKPDKVHTLFKDEIASKLWPLPVGDLFMVGKKTKEELNKLKIYTIYDLAKADEKKLRKHFKNQTSYLKNASCGIDNSKVEQKSDKTISISISETLPYDCSDSDKLLEILLRQTEDVTRQLRSKGQYATTVAVIYKNNRFVKYSAQEKLNNPTDNTKIIYTKVVEIFKKSYKEDPIRLIGIRLADLKMTKEKQLSLFNMEEQEEDQTIQKTIDNINKKYGSTAITSASLRLVGKKYK